MKKDTALSLFFIFNLCFPAFCQEEVISKTADYKEIPYYLKQLEQTPLEEKRIEYNKIIHDALVQANLLDKKVVKELEPIVEKIMRAMDSGLDRTNLSGEVGWLSSAVDFFEREKLRPIIDIPTSDWLESELQLTPQIKLSTYPDKILIHHGDQSSTLVESSNIHEAVISPDGKKVAFFRKIKPEGSQAEIWMVTIKNKKMKKCATVVSCYTILFSLDSDTIFYQEKPKLQGDESAILRLSASWGGNPKKICSGTLLQTVVAKGKYQGNLVVYRQTIHHLGKAVQDCPYAYSESGKELGRLKNGPCK